MNTICGCPCTDNSCFNTRYKFYTTCVYSNYYTYTGYANSYAAVYYRSYRWRTQSQLYSIQRISESMLGNLQKKFIRTSPLLSLYYILVSVASVNVGDVTDNCQSIYDYCSNLTEYINNSTLELSTEQIILLTNLNTKLLASTQQLCTDMKDTIDDCSNSKRYNPAKVRKMEEELSIVQTTFETLSIEVGNVSYNVYALVSGTQYSYQVLATGYLNGTTDLKTTVEYLDLYRIYFRNWWRSLYGYWHSTLSYLNGITSSYVSSSLNLTIYFNNNIRIFTNSSITNGSNVIDVGNIDVFDCNYNYRNNIVVQINQVMVKIILEILAVSILSLIKKFPNKK